MYKYVNINFCIVNEKIIFHKKYLLTYISNIIIIKKKRKYFKFYSFIYHL